MTDKQQAFVNSYLKCRNAAQAARDAGYNGRSDVVGHQVRWNEDVAAEISRRTAMMGMEADEAIALEAEIARGEWGQYLEPRTAGFQPVLNWERLAQDGKGRLVKKVNVNEHGVSVEFPDRQAALTNILKLHGRLTEKVDNTNHDPDLMRAIELLRSAGGDSAVEEALSEPDTGAAG